MGITLKNRSTYIIKEYINNIFIQIRNTFNNYYHLAKSLNSKALVNGNG